MRTCKQNSNGFTIIELLIVVVVIAILAAIVIVAYNGILGQARASAAQSSVEQVVKKEKMYAVENSDQYTADLAALGFTNSGDTTYQYSVNNTVTPATFCVTVTVFNVSYFASSAHTAPAKGGCPGHGQDGVASVTNLVTNPNFSAGSGTVEVWRNLAYDPRAVGANPVLWQALSTSNSTRSFMTDAGTYARGTATSNTSAFGLIGLADTGAIATGESFVVRAQVRPSRSIAAGWTVDLRQAGVATVATSSATPALPAGIWTDVAVTLTTNTSSTGDAHARFSVAAQAGDTLDVRNLLVMRSTAGIAYFDGATSPDPDLVPSWTGTPNASASILSGVALWGVAGGGSGTGRAVYQSSVGTNKALAVMRTTGGDLEEAAGAVLWTSTSADIGKTYAAIATLHQDAAGSNANFADRALRAIYLYKGGATSDIVRATNAAGTYPLRLTFTVTAANQSVRLGGGGGIVVRWTQAGLFAGDYAGAYHDGSSPNWIWNGTPNASTSTGPGN